MNKLLAVAPLLVLLGRPLAAGPSPLQDSESGTNVEWKSYKELPGGIDASEASVAADSEGYLHFLQRFTDVDAHVEHIRYFHNRPGNPGPGGFSVPVILDSSGTDFQNPTDEVDGPDIWVDEQDVVHGVWSHHFFAPANTRRIRYWKFERNVGSSVEWLTEPTSGQFHHDPQVAVTASGQVHVLAYNINFAGPTDRVAHIVKSAGPPAVGYINGAEPVGSVRFALKGNRICATWAEFGNPWTIKCSQGTIASGSTSWGAKQQVSSSPDGRHDWPDVDLESDGTPHFVWTHTTDRNRIVHAKLGASSTTVSTDPAASGPFFSFERGARVRIQGNQVHVFYGGFSHAVMGLQESEWRRAQPLEAAGASNLSEPLEVAMDFKDRFILVAARYFVKSKASSVDGTSWESAFPGGSINLVPINGSLRYRLDLFKTNGVGPTASLGLTYSSRERSSTFLGSGWNMDHLPSLTLDDDENVTLVLPNGLSFAFTSDAAGNFTMQDPSFGFISQVKKTFTGWSLRTESGTTFDFTLFGKLGLVTDPAGNYLRVDYDAQGRPSQLVDQLGNGSTVGRTTLFEYGTGIAARLLTRVIDPAGGRYRLDYTNGRLSSVVFESGPDTPTYSFDYNTGGQLSKVTPPRGQVAPKYGYSIFYDPAGRVERVEDPTELYLLDGETGLPSTRTATMRVFYNQDSAIVGQNKFHTRVADRRGVSSIHVFNPARSFAVSELWDAAAVAGTPGIVPIVRTHDQHGNVLTQRDRWGFTTTMEYFQLTTADAGYWMTNLVKNVRKPNPAGVGDELVEEFTYTADEFRNVATHTTYVAPGQGRTTTYDYDDFGRIETTLFPDVTRADGSAQSGVKRVNTYNGPRRQLSRTVNEEQRGTDFLVFHPIHGLPESVLQEGGTQTEETRYDIMGNVLQTRRPQGGPGNDVPGFITNQLDGLYRLERVTDPRGEVTINSYDVDSHLISRQPPAGNPTSTTYDSRGFASGGTTPDGSWTQVVDANGNVRRKTSLRGFTSAHRYDSLNRTIETRSPGASTLGGGIGGGGPERITRWVHEGFSASGHFSEEKRIQLNVEGFAAEERTTTTFFDNRVRAVRVVAPDQKTVTTKTYDSLDQVTSAELTFDGTFQMRTETFRDARDRVHRILVKGLAAGQLSESITLLNRVGSVVKTIDPNGNTTESILDARERVFKVKDGKGKDILMNVWGDDDLLSEVHILDPATKSETFVLKERRTYTSRKEPRTVVNRNLVGLAYEYNAIQDQVRTVTDSRNRVTRTTYYADTQRVNEVIVAENTPNQRITKNVWQNGLLTETRVYNPQSQAYDAVFRNFYDEADRLERFEAPLVAPERYSYSAFDQEQELVVDSSTPKILTHSYNSLGQRTSTAWTGAFSKTETRTYNGIGQVESLSNGTHEKVMLYDTWLGTPAMETFKVGGAVWKVQSHVYDVGKRYTHLVDPEGAAHEWAYDEDNRVTEIRYGAQGVCETRFTVGGLVDRTFMKDASGAVIAETVHTYDGLGRKLRQQSLHASSRQTLADFEWGYDELDLVTLIKVNHLGVKADVEYNERRELTKELWSGNNGGRDAPPYLNLFGGPATGPESDPSNEASGVPQVSTTVGAVTKVYGYDPGGNRRFMEVGADRTDYTYNAASQLISETSPAGTVAHEYDEWGNEVRRETTPSGGGTPIVEAYLYNYQNLMADYTKSGGAHWQYAFWPTGERYSKENQNDVADVELYIPRSGDVVTEYSSPTQLKNSYAQGAGVDQKCVRIAASGDRRHYLGDAVGTLSLTLTDTASVSESSLKDVWGNQLSGGTTLERYGFSQRERDQESDLVYMRARMYDPARGRFTQTDPILGNRAGDHYAYASNDPVTHTDRFGLQDDKRPVQVKGVLSFPKEEQRESYYNVYSQHWMKMFRNASKEGKYYFDASQPKYLIGDVTDEVGIVRELNKGDVGVLIAHGEDDKIQLPNGKFVSSKDIANIEPGKAGIKTKLLICVVCQGKQDEGKLAEAFAKVGVKVVVTASGDAVDVNMSTFTQRFLKGMSSTEEGKRESIDSAFEAAAKEAGFWNPDTKKVEGIVLKTAAGVDRAKPVELDK